MKKILLAISLLYSLAVPSQAYHIWNNPDAWPSLSLGYSTTRLSGSFQERTNISPYNRDHNWFLQNGAFNNTESWNATLTLPVTSGMSLVFGGGLVNNEFNLHDYAMTLTTFNFVRDSLFEQYYNLNGYNINAAVKLYFK